MSSPRNLELATATAKDIGLPNIKVMKCDLASFASVREFCMKVIKEERKVDILVNNASAFSTKRVVTEDGQEMVFQVSQMFPPFSLVESFRVVKYFHDVAIRQQYFVITNLKSGLCCPSQFFMA